MKRIATVLVLFLLPALAVANGVSPGAAMLLTPGAAVHVPITGGGDRLRLSLQAIDNPDRAPFGIIVQRSDGAEIGRISIFPPDRTGDYFLSITGPAPAGEVALSIEPLGDAAPVAVELSATLE